MFGGEPASVWLFLGRDDFSTTESESALREAGRRQSRSSEPYTTLNIHLIYVLFSLVFTITI